MWAKFADGLIVVVLFDFCGSCSLVELIVLGGGG